MGLHTKLIVGFLVAAPGFCPSKLKSELFSSYSNVVWSMGLITDGVVEEEVERVQDVCRRKAFTASEQKHFVLPEQIYFREGKL